MMSFYAVQLTNPLSNIISDYGKMQCVEKQCDKYTMKITVVSVVGSLVALSFCILTSHALYGATSTVTVGKLAVVNNEAEKAYTYDYLAE